MRRAVAWVTTEPTRPALRVLRALALLAAGLIVILDREAVIALLFTLVGVYLIYAGVSAILRLVYRAPDERPAAAAPRRSQPRRLAAPLRPCPPLLASRRRHARSEWRRARRAGRLSGKRPGSHGAAATPAHPAQTGRGSLPKDDHHTAGRIR